MARPAFFGMGSKIFGVLVRDQTIVLKRIFWEKGDTKLERMCAKS